MSTPLITLESVGTFDLANLATSDKKGVHITFSGPFAPKRIYANEKNTVLLNVDLQEPTLLGCDDCVLSRNFNHTMGDSTLKLDGIDPEKLEGFNRQEVGWHTLACTICAEAGNCIRRATVV